MATKSKKKMETIAFTSPFGTARFPKITKPDTDGKYADNKFKTGLLLEDGDVEKVRAIFVDATKKLLPGVPLADINLPLKEFADKDKDSGEKKPIGWGFNAKSQRRPLVLDAKKNKLPEGTNIGGGSEIRIGGAIAAYSKASKMAVVENGVKRIDDVTEHGLTVYLNSVQVRALRSGGGASDGSEFDAVEGFEYDGSANTESTTDDATDL